MQIDYKQEGNPERNLWSSVVETAWDDLKKKRNSQALNFFKSENSNFPWICAQLCLPKEEIRRRAERKAGL